MKFQIPSLLILAGACWGCSSVPLTYSEKISSQYSCSEYQRKKSPSAQKACSLEVQANAQKAVESFNKKTVQLDISKGSGLNQAVIYGEFKDAIYSPEKKTDRSAQVTSFYERLNRDGYLSPGGTAVAGTPTRVYSRNGEIAYIAFDSQPVSLLEFSAKSKSYRAIPGQDSNRHSDGFGSPVGKLKDFSAPLSEYTIMDLRQMLGREGDAATLVFESGVKIEGVIEKYTVNEFTDGKHPSVITFKAGTAKVSFGSHVLFEPGWGAFDLLIMNRMTNSEDGSPAAQQWMRENSRSK